MARCAAAAQTEGRRAPTPTLTQQHTPSAVPAARFIHAGSRPLTLSRLRGGRASSLLPFYMRGAQGTIRFSHFSSFPTTRERAPSPWKRVRRRLPANREAARAGDDQSDTYDCEMETARWRPRRWVRRRGGLWWGPPARCQCRLPHPVPSLPPPLLSRRPPSSATTPPDLTDCMFFPPETRPGPAPRWMVSEIPRPAEKYLRAPRLTSTRDAITRPTPKEEDGSAEGRERAWGWCEGCRGRGGGGEETGGR
jgi:hypothetical protein